jgi:hypothetical protein
MRAMGLFWHIWGRRLGGSDWDRFSRDVGRWFTLRIVTVSSIRTVHGHRAPLHKLRSIRQNLYSTDLDALRKSKQRPSSRRLVNERPDSGRLVLMVSVARNSTVVSEVANWERFLVRSNVGLPDRRLTGDSCTAVMSGNHRRAKVDNPSVPWRMQRADRRRGPESFRAETGMNESDDASRSRAQGQTGDGQEARVGRKGSIVS